MSPPTNITDTWFGPLIAMAAGGITAFFQGMDMPAIVLWVVAAGWGLAKFRNELTRARILSFTEKGQEEAERNFKGPYRRKTDAVHFINTEPGNFSK